MAKTRIKHVFGNRIIMRIPLTGRTVTVTDSNVNKSDEAITPTEAVVRFEKGYGSVRHDVAATIAGNVVIMVDDGTIPIGTWDITVITQDSSTKPSLPLRYKQNAVLDVVDSTADGGSYGNDEVDVLAYYPVINGRSSAVVIGDDYVTIYADRGLQADIDNEGVNLRVGYGESQVEVGEDNVSIHINN